MTEYDKQIEGYKATKAVFTDYTRFEGDERERADVSAVLAERASV